MCCNCVSVRELNFCCPNLSNRANVCATHKCVSVAVVFTRVEQSIDSGAGACGLYTDSLLVRRCRTQWPARSDATAVEPTAPAVGGFRWGPAWVKVADCRDVQHWTTDISIRASRAPDPTVRDRTHSPAGNVFHAQSHPDGDGTHARRGNPAAATATAPPPAAATADPTATAAPLRRPPQRRQWHRGHSQPAGGRVRLRW